MNALKPREAMLVVTGKMKPRALDLEAVLNEAAVRTTRVALEDEHDFEKLQQMASSWSAAPSWRGSTSRFGGGLNVERQGCDKLARRPSRPDSGENPGAKERTMKVLEYTVRFVTPAFLGDAEQSGQWRTPPFKALLRQWWRVAYARDKNFQVNVDEMRRAEGLVFGNAWLSHREGNREVTDHSKSLIRIRLDKWNEGEATKGKWGQQDPASQKVVHPEVGNIGPLLYLGYGPLDAQKATRQGQARPEYLTVLKRNAAIQAGESATLSVAVPDVHTAKLQRALWLMDRYGTAGGRSRNGWGSFSLTHLNETPALTGDLPLRPWRDALGLDWPHAIGTDAKPLIWQTKPFNGWKQLMRELAIIKIGLRTQFNYTLESANGDKPIMKRGEQTGINHGKPQLRHWLSYPITNHPLSPWGGNARLPNSLRFKVRPDPDDPKQFVGVIFHVPCRPPPEFTPDLKAIGPTWQAVHALLDDLTRSAQSRTYSSISNTDRRAKLKAQLDAVTLTRIPQ